MSIPLDAALSFQIGHRQTERWMEKWANIVGREKSMEEKLNKQKDIELSICYR